MWYTFRVKTSGARAQSWLHTPRCARCGIDVPEASAGLPGIASAGRAAAAADFVCPNCGEDWYARPPRSYAEREGIPSGALPSRSGVQCGLKAEMESHDGTPRRAGPMGWLQRVLAALMFGGGMFGGGMFGGGMFGAGSLGGVKTGKSTRSARTPGRNL